MILVWLLIITAGAGIVAWAIGAWSRTASRWVALIALGADLALLIFVWVSYGANGGNVRIADFGFRISDSGNDVNPQSAIRNPQSVSPASMLMKAR